MNRERFVQMERELNDSVRWREKLSEEVTKLEKAIQVF